MEGRLKRLAQEENIDLQRVRRQAAFDRLLSRLFSKPESPWLLKGGYAMELRLKTARATRDMDLALKQLPTPTRDWDANASTVLEALREVGQLDLEDFFTFVFGNAIHDLDTAPYGGVRFPVDARLAGRSFVKFHLDVGTWDVLREPYEFLSGRDWLGFAGIASTVCRAVSPEEQFAEKLYAYTLPQGSRPSWMGCFWRWPENDSSVNFYAVPLCESNDSKSRFQPRGGLSATLWPGAMPRGRRF